MEYIGMSILMTAIYMVLFYIFGGVVLGVLKYKEASVPQLLVVGYFGYFLLFQLVALPFKSALKPLRWLSITWLLILAAVVILWIFLGRKISRESLKQACEKWKAHTWCFLALFVVLAVGLVACEWNDFHGAYWDETYYIGDVAESVYTNTISQHDPYTGELMETLDEEYFLETYQNHSAVMCQVFGVHPLVETRTVLVAVTILMFACLMYQIAMVLQGNKISHTVWLLVFLAVVYFFSFNSYTSAQILIFRAYEGKAVLASIILMMMMYQFLKIRKDTADKGEWLILLLSVWGSFGINMSSVYMIPFELSGLLLPLAATRRDKKVFFGYVLCMLICAVYAGLYLMMKTGRWTIYTS